MTAAHMRAIADAAAAETLAEVRVKRVAKALATGDLAAHLRDARSNEEPCIHWIGQPLAVCSPCLRDRIVPHVADALAEAGLLADP